MVNIFCPNCFEDIGPDAEICKSCSIDAKKWMTEKSYGERLTHGLNHPLAEVRMRAIISLGKLKEVMAAIPLAQCALEHPLDVVQRLEIIHALKQMDFEREVAMSLEMLEGHPVRAIRKAVYLIRNREKTS